MDEYSLDKVRRIQGVRAWGITILMRKHVTGLSYSNKNDLFFFFLSFINTSLCTEFNVLKKRTYQLRKRYRIHERETYIKKKRVIKKKRRSLIRVDNRKKKSVTS